MKAEFAELANYANLGNLTKGKTKLSRAFEVIVDTLGLENGSLKIFVHQGKVSPRLEIQANISKQIEG